ncbi:MAG: nitroreductase family protein [Candidatus Atribacteria bacterium]
MELIEVIKRRRSIRKFKSDKIPKEDIYDIIRAATLAPSNCCISVGENTSGRETLEIPNQELKPKLLKDIDEVLEFVD